MALRPADLREERLGARIATAFALAIVGVLAVLAGGWIWAGLLLATVAGAAFELARLVERGRTRERRFALGTTLLAGSLVFSTAAAGPASGLVLFAILLPVGVGLFALAGGNAFALGAAVFYLGVPFACLVWLRLGAPGGLIFTLWLLLVVAATDTGAYVAGRSIGGPRLAPALSPGKTWAGLFGGMLAAAVTGAVFVLFVRGHGPQAALSSGLLAAVLAVVAQCGDLTESWLKRRSGYKDSGRLLPGHGGLLDRVDGLLFAAPVYTGVVLFLTGGSRP
jgi:phosphatidate cytidylyltransferase